MLAAASFLGCALPLRARPAPAARRPAQICTAEQKLEGTVVSVAGVRSVVVNVQRQVAHPIYKKRVFLSKKYMAHDESQACKVGDVVRIAQCRPMSARKHFTVSEVLKAAFIIDAPLPNETATA